jgi:hypothetical protein
MRVTRQSLIRIAKETVQERVYNDHDIIAAYLTGSLLTEEPMLGGTADIDLVFVYNQKPLQAREFVKLTPDFHLDITRRTKGDYKSPRELRADPWLGYEMYDPMLLHEREKFFEFVQAGLRAGSEFEGAPLILLRCRALYTQARQGWQDVSNMSAQAAPKELRIYLEAVYWAANTIAELTGPPIPERRLLLEFPERAQAAERPGMSAGLLGLLGANQFNPEKIDPWLSDWKNAFTSACQTDSVDVRIHPARLNYYEKAIKAMLGGDRPIAALWPLIHTWTLAANVLEAEQLKAWHLAGSDLELAGAAFAQRIQGLDHYLDEIEMLLDEFAAANGLETSTSI